MNIATQPEFLGFLNLIDKETVIHYANLYSGNNNSIITDATAYEIATFNEGACALRMSSNQITIPNHDQMLFSHTGIFNFVLLLVTATLRIPTNLTVETSGNGYLQIIRKELINGVQEGPNRTVGRIRNKGLIENEYKSVSMAFLWGSDIPKEEGHEYTYELQKQGFMELSDLSMTMIGFSKIC